MKATGAVRRIDDLGRVVIPKEIRKQLGIKEGEPLEFFIDENNNIVLSRINNYKLSVWTLSDDEENIQINEINGVLDYILICLRDKYRFTEAETTNILNLFKKNENPDFSTELYGLEFYISKR